MNIGHFNPQQLIEKQGISGVRNAHYNLLEPALVQAALERGEGELGQAGTLLVTTGKFSGRSPKDKFTVAEPSVKDGIWWENNPPMEPAAFDALRKDMFAYLADRDVFIQDLYAGADPEFRINVRQIHEFAWHNLFIRHMLRRPQAEDLDGFVPEFTVVNCPGFAADPAKHGCRSNTVIAVSFEQRLVLIGGTGYGGENKKSIFSIMNYLLPERDVMPMHCSANHAVGNPDDTAIFFGLSGTGKTTLSADPNRVLLGDDEHGWTDTSTFNFEGGCYAKTIHLSEEAEPEIFATTSKFGTVIENMVYDPYTKELDFEDDSISSNMRCAYPLEFISNASATGISGQPKNIIMLTCDAYGVLPPIARLTPAQAMYHFLSGFTSKVAGTELGVTEPQPTFSTCFGAPFMPRRPEVYGMLLRKRITESNAQCWLVNSGWTGGAFGSGKRMPIRATRALLTAALDGSLNSGAFRRDENFGFEVPVAGPGVDDRLLDPRSTWADEKAYDEAAAKLRNMFADNFTQYEGQVDSDVLNQAIQKMT